MTRRGVPTKVPEGGWGWMVRLASCWINCVVFGVINSFCVLYMVILNLDSVMHSKQKRRLVDSPSSSSFVLVQSLLHMIMVLAIILAGSPVLIAGSDSTEQVILQAGQPAMIPFDIPLSPNNISQVFPLFTLGFASEPRPFYINRKDDIKGFKSRSQFSRFTTSVAAMASSLRVRVNIDPVDIEDEDTYVLRAFFHGSGPKLVKREIVVRIPPGRAKCYITRSENNNYPYEVHCQATTGSIETTLTCYQHGQRVEVKGDVTENGQVTRGVFLLPDHSPFSCCSHDITSEVNVTMCNDFEWPPRKNSIRPSTVNNPILTPSPSVQVFNTEQAESQVNSSTCKQYMTSLFSLTMGMMIYLVL